CLLPSAFCLLIMWPLRIAASRLRPFNAATLVRTAIVVVVVALFLVGDYALFARLFRAIAGVESETPIFALGLLRNLLGLVFLVASVTLFSSSMAAAIASFFTDLDLDIYHAGPRTKLRIAVARWLKTLMQSATVVCVFLVPLVIAFGRQYDKPLSFYAVVLANLVLLLTIPVTLASVVILLLVRWFPVRRVYQIVASIAALVLTLVVIAFRMSRPERFFAELSTVDVAEVLRAIELPSMSVYPSTALAELMTKSGMPWLAPRIGLTALLAFAGFVMLSRAWYFRAFVRARESMAPTAIGASSATRILDRIFARADPPLRAMIGKEVRTIGRDVAQWSQIFLMGALLFIYLYNIRMLPLGGDARATLVAYANLGMSGFVIAAICLRFAYPSVSAEGKAFWIIQSAPISYRDFLIVKVAVYAAPLTLLSILLTAVANFILDANAVVWTFTLAGALLLAVTLVSLGVGLGALAPNFNAENPLQVGLSLGGFGYMAVALAYVAAVMVLMARPMMRYVLRVAGVEQGALSATIPIVIALTLSVLLSVISLLAAERRLTRFKSD
ncbi:MAG: putative ABC transporter permease subunit, partial [Thermoanaerobaculia bacterium]